MPTTPTVKNVQRGAYLTDGQKLYQVMDVTENKVTLQNCMTEYSYLDSIRNLLNDPWQLVKEAPTAPDSLGKLALPEPG